MASTASHHHLTIAAIVPSFRRGRYLIETIKHLYRQTRPPNEIIVVDQTPIEEYTLDQRQWLREECDAGRIRWVHQKEPAVSRARNRAIQETQCEVLLYLDDDIIPDRTLVGRHLCHYTDQSVSGVTGLVVHSAEERLVPVPGDFSARSPEVQAYTYQAFESPLHGVAFMYGGNFSVRRAALLAVQGWDEHILNYGDRDLGLRLAKAGIRIDYDPAARIIHLCAPIGGTRVTDPYTPWRGWRRCVSVWYLAFRHLHGPMFVRFGAVRAGRFSFLLRQNFIRPWRWPSEILSYLVGCFVAWRWSRVGLVSPFVPNTNCAASAGRGLWRKQTTIWRQFVPTPVKIMARRLGLIQ